MPVFNKDTKKYYAHLDNFPCYSAQNASAYGKSAIKKRVRLRASFYFKQLSQSIDVNKLAGQPVRRKINKCLANRRPLDKTVNAVVSRAASQ